MPQLWAQFRSSSPAVAVATGITASMDVDAVVAEFSHRAADRLLGHTVWELPEIRAWRQAFSQMGLKPTQYRCASEALLRRFCKDRAPPQVTRWSTSATPSPSLTPPRSRSSTSTA